MPEGFELLGQESPYRKVRQKETSMIPDFNDPKCIAKALTHAAFTPI
jgi:hypothetical protein